MPEHVTFDVNLKERSQTIMKNSIWIELKNAVFHCHIGHYNDERQKKQKIFLDLSVRISYTLIKEDELSKTINYEKLYIAVKKIVTSEKHYLLENLGQCIIDKVQNEFQLAREIKILLQKESPPIKSFQGELSVTMHKIFD